MQGLHAQSVIYISTCLHDESKGVRLIDDKPKACNGLSNRQICRRQYKILWISLTYQVLPQLLVVCDDAIVDDDKL